MTTPTVRGTALSAARPHAVSAGHQEHAEMASATSLASLGAVHGSGSVTHGTALPCSTTVRASVAHDAPATVRTLGAGAVARTLGLGPSTGTSASAR